MLKGSLHHIHLFIVDDHPDVLHALAAQISVTNEMFVVDTATNVDEALNTIRLLQPDVILVETKRADGRGLELIDSILQTQVKSKIAVLTSYFNEWERLKLLTIGVNHYLLKDISSDHLIEQITTLAV